MTPGGAPMRDTVTCGQCELVQFRPEGGVCRRCKKPLRGGSVDATSVVVIAARDPHVKTMTEVKFEAAQHAVESLGMMRGAEALAVSTDTLKRLLRKGGVDTDFRTQARRREVAA